MNRDSTKMDVKIDDVLGEFDAAMDRRHEGGNETTMIRVGSEVVPMLRDLRNKTVGKDGKEKWESYGTVATTWLKRIPLMQAEIKRLREVVKDNGLG